MGLHLLGEVQQTGMLPLKFTPALLTEDALVTHSKLRRSLIEKDCPSAGDAEIDQEVWNQTLAECEKGWLVGPLSSDQVPLSAPVSKRFGLRQKHKVRLIDDYSESSVNSTVTVFESPTLHTVDIACAAIACWFGDCEDQHKCPELLVKTFDLASAYRQVGLSKDGRKVSFIRVKNPETGKWAFFQAQVLPFGAIKSVHSFLRLARALWWIGTTACLLAWSSFFDDYILLSTPALSRSSELTASALFALLGWDCAREGRKFLPFGVCCEALGVLFDLVESGKGLCQVRNTESRVSELVAELKRVIATKRISQAEAQRLRGRMQFADSQLFGRTGKRCTKALREAACRRHTALTKSDLRFLEMFVKLLESGKPRIIKWEPQPAVLIYTDACYERDSDDLICGLGGVLIDSNDNQRLFFSCRLDSKQRAVLGELEKKQIIFEAETFCAVLAYLLWRDRIERRYCFLFVDNEGTKFSLMKGASENATVDDICAIFAETEVHTDTVCWLARVPSYSNIADGPSRAETQKLLANGFLDHSEFVMTFVEKLLAFMLVKRGERG